MAGFGTVVLPIDENAASSGIGRMERMYQVILQYNISENAGASLTAISILVRLAK